MVQEVKEPSGVKVEHFYHQIQLYPEENNMWQVEQAEIVLHAKHKRDKPLLQEQPAYSNEEERQWMQEMERIDRSLDMNYLLEQQKVSLPINGQLDPIMENSEQSENITYYSDSHQQISFDELVSINAQQ